MAVCVDCGKKFGFVEARYGGPNANVCLNCKNKAMNPYGLSDEQIEQALVLEDEKRGFEDEKRRLENTAKSKAIKAILLTTETAPNLNIKSRVGIIMVDADCAFDVAMVKNKDALLNKLKSEANLIGANAVVGITFDMIETYSASIGIGKVNTFKLIAYGTAVVIVTDEGVL